MIRLGHHLKNVGVGHRSGWPFVMDSLQRIETPDGIMFDDFVERSFRLNFEGWQEPWVGMWHHPPNMPRWFNPEQTLDAITSSIGFKRAVKHLKGNVATSNYLAKDLRLRFPEIPCTVLKHPTETVPTLFDFDRWQNNDCKMMQVGWYLRNYKGIYQVFAPNTKKIHLWQDKPWINHTRKRIDKNCPHKDRPLRGTVYKCHEMPNENYDQAMASCIVFLELYDASANNAVIEAMIRNTPIVVNRHPAVEEYLGKDYPLFYDDFRQVAWLTEPQAVRSAHEYLINLDKTELGIDYFVDNLSDFIESVR